MNVCTSFHGSMNSIGKLLLWITCKSYDWTIYGWITPFPQFLFGDYNPIHCCQTWFQQLNPYLQPGWRTLPSPPLPIILLLTLLSIGGNICPTFLVSNSKFTLMSSSVLSPYPLALKPVALVDTKIDRNGIYNTNYAPPKIPLPFQIRPMSHTYWSPLGEIPLTFPSKLSSPGPTKYVP